MNVATLRADCARCAALCCVALAFDRSHLFGFDKKAGEVCTNLDACGRCRIHASKARHGFAGCAAYDCAGAGQRVTPEIFGGRSWRDDPDLLLPMQRAFVAMSLVQQTLLLLAGARRLPLTDAERNAVTAFETELEPSQGWTYASLLAAPVHAMSARVQAFLPTLRHHLT